MSTCGVFDARSASESGILALDSFSEGGGLRKFRDVINEARMVAMLNPLGRNERPVYTAEDGEPCCFFGHVLVRLGINLSYLNPLQMCGFAQMPWDDWGFEAPNTYQVLWTTKVQAAADNGDAWIIAIAMADATLI